MNIQQIINEKLSENLNKFGRLVALNKIGNRIILYGYIRAIKDDYIVWQNNDGPEYFKIRNVILFDPI